MSRKSTLKAVDLPQRGSRTGCRENLAVNWVPMRSSWGIISTSFPPFGEPRGIPTRVLPVQRDRGWPRRPLFARCVQVREGWSRKRSPDSSTSMQDSCNTLPPGVSLTLTTSPALSVHLRIGATCVIRRAVRKFDMGSWVIMGCRLATHLLAAP